jgi:hypothetical protein
LRILKEAVMMNPLREITEDFVGEEVVVELSIGGRPFMSYQGKVGFFWSGGSLEALRLGKTFLWLSRYELGLEGKCYHRCEYNSFGPGVSALSLVMGDTTVRIFRGRGEFDLSCALTGAVEQKAG